MVKTRGFITVTNSADSGAGSLRQAINDASAGDIITFDSSISSIILITGQIIIAKNLSIHGLGADKLSLSGNNSSRVFQIETGIECTIAGISLINGNANNGGAIENSGTLNLIASTLSSNDAANYGGAIYNLNSGTLNITKSTLSGNSSAEFGGAIMNHGIISLINSTLSGNSTVIYGGAIYNFSDGRINSSFITIAENAARQGAGIFCERDSKIAFKNSIIANNTGIKYAGAGIIAVYGTNFDTDETYSGFTQVSSKQLNLGPLALNSPGTTRTHALLRNSIAIDKAIENTDIAGNIVATDQRGIPRPQNRVSDVGAFEVIREYNLVNVRLNSIITWGYPDSTRRSKSSEELGEFLEKNKNQVVVMQTLGGWTITGRIVSISDSTAIFSEPMVSV